jgi:transposase InsO family protein
VVPRIRILGTTAHQTHSWVTRTVRNLLMDLEDASQLAIVRFLIRDRDAKYPAIMDQILQGAGIATVLTGVQVPRMNAVMERWVRTLRAELLDWTLIWNEAHLRRVLRIYERHYNQHRPHRSLASAAPLRAVPRPLEPRYIERLDIRRHDRLSGVLHEYRHAA